MNLSMKKMFGSSFVMWAVLALAGLIYLFTFVNYRPVFRQNRIKLGIDLVGGTYITLGVQTEKAIQAELTDITQSLLKKLPEDNKELPNSQVLEKEIIVLKFDSEKAAHAASSFFATQESRLQLVVEGNILKVWFKDVAAQRIRDYAVKSNIDVLRNRLDNLGVGEITIAAQGDKNIIVELPQVSDPQQAKAMIGKSALLEIKLVERMGMSPEEILDEYEGELPEGMIIVPGKEEGGRKTYYLVPAFTDITGRLLRDAYAGLSQDSHEVVVNFRFTPEGGDKFYELTRKNFKRHIAIIVDGVVISAPTVNATIHDAGQISGNFTQASANELAMLLKSGAFVAPVTFEEERQIGPSLGAEAIRQGGIACLAGLGLLFIFSIIAYKVAGLFAFITLLYNLLLIMLALVWFKATLTLPGIAGLVLTVGMAIDASILIYEKIREELAAGTAIGKAVDIGFSDAMEVILDSNITTFIVGAVLFKFGTGPIQGFALTMMIGIISTLITGLFFLRSLFTFFLYNIGIKKLKI